MKRIRNLLLIFIFVSGLGLRLLNINTPLLDWYSWRQTTTAMTSRSYYYNGYKILYPECDYNGPEGYVACEFPIYNFIVAMFYKFFGVKEYLGKLVSIFFSILAMFLFFRLVKKYYSRTVAVWALLAFSFLPHMIFYSQVFMPDMMMFFCSIGTIYYFDLWLEKEKTLSFLLSALLSALAISIKPFCLYLLLPLFYLAYLKYKKAVFISIPLWIYLFMILALPVFWYGFWHKNLDATLFGSLWRPSDRWGNMSWWLNYKWYIRMIFERLGENWLLGSGFIFFILGMVKKTDNRKQRMFHIWLSGIIIYFFVIAQGNWQHEYYQLPIMAPACVFIGNFLGKFFQKHYTNKTLNLKNIKVLIVIFLILIMIPVGITKFLHHTEPMMEYYFAAESVRRIAQKDDLILVSDYDMPEVIYYSQRKGWHIRPQWQTIDVIEDFRSRGVRYYITTALDDFHKNVKFSNYMSKKYKVIESVPGKGGYIIIDLK